MPDSSLKLLLEDPTDLGSQQSYLCCTKWSCANECICLSYFCFAFSSSSFHAKAEHSREHHTKRERERARAIQPIQLTSIVLFSIPRLFFSPSAHIQSALSFLQLIPSKRQCHFYAGIVICLPWENLDIWALSLVVIPTPAHVKNITFISRRGIGWYQYVNSLYRQKPIHCFGKDQN